ASQDLDDLFADLNVKTAKPSHERRSLIQARVSSFADQTNTRWHPENQRMVNSMSSISSASERLSEISLKSNDALSTSSTSSMTSTSAFGFIGNSVPNNGKSNQSFQSQSQRPSSILKANRMSKANKVSLEELGINTDRTVTTPLWKSMKTLETDQANALTNEDYIQADKLTHDIQELNSKIQTFCGVLPGIEQTLNELREKQVKYLKSQAEISKTLEKEFIKKKKEEEEAFKQYAADMENLHNIETKKINEMRKEIDKENSEIVFGLDIWNKGVADLNERIEERVRDEKLERESLLKKRENVQTQIAELLQRLEKLRAEEESYTRQITDIDLQIESITTEFHVERDENTREKNDLDRRRHEIDNKTRHVEEVETNLHQRLENYRKRQETSQEQLESLEQRIGEIKLTAKVYREESAEVEKLIEHLKDRNQRDNDCEKEIFDIRLQMEESDTEVKRLTSKVMHDQQTYSTIKQDISTIDTQIPALEEQKKLAVAGRDFKSAGRLANRIKDLQSTRDERTKFLETKRASLERDQESLKASRKILEENTTKFAEAVKRIGSELGEELQESLLQLRSRYDVATQQKLNTLQSLLQNEIQGMEYRINHVRVRYGIATEEDP
ncbi:12325_t:CDS:10, partial [Dentiscutata erythropus]